MKITNGKGEPTKELFIFLKYNKILETEPIELLESDKIIFEDFVARFKNFAKNFEENKEAAVADIVAIATMFGFNRHYDEFSGKPIIGKYYKIGKKIVSKEAYESYKIIKEMEKDKNGENNSRNKSFSTTKKHSSNNQSFKKHQ